MAKNTSYAYIYGDEAGGVWVAPKGTTGPVDLAAPPVGFVEVGWMSEDGVNESADSSSETIRAWQGAKIVKRVITNNDRSFSFQAMEENAVTHGLKYRGAVPVVSGTAPNKVATTTVTNQTTLDERAFVIDLVAGDVMKRYVIPNGAHEVTGQATYANGQVTTLEITVTPIGDYFEITNNPAIATP